MVRIYPRHKIEGSKYVLQQTGNCGSLHRACSLTISAVFGMSFSQLNSLSIQFLSLWQPHIRAGLVYECSHCDDGCLCHSNIPQQLCATSLFQMCTQLCHCWGRETAIEVLCSTGLRNTCGAAWWFTLTVWRTLWCAFHGQIAAITDVSQLFSTLQLFKLRH